MMYQQGREGGNGKKPSRNTELRKMANKERAGDYYMKQSGHVARMKVVAYTRV